MRLLLCKDGYSTTLTARRVWYGVGARSHLPARSSGRYKAVRPPPLFHQLSPSFLLALHFSDISYLRPLASSTSALNPPLQAHGPTERYDEVS